MSSAYWKMILDGLDDHFGESSDLEQQTKSLILGYLNPNAAEHYTANRAAEIMKSLRGLVPRKITETLYLMEKDHELSLSVFEREAVGSLSNCIACHTRAEKGIYDDDKTSIPR